jgi:HEAT repeat protein
MPSFRLPVPQGVRVLALSAVALAGTAECLRAQPGSNARDDRPADTEMRRRVEPMLPSIRAGLLSDSPEAQRAALAVLGDIPPGLAGNLSNALTAFLQKDVKDPSLVALGLRAFGKVSPDAVDIPKVIGKHVRSEDVDVRRAAAEALAGVIENSIPVGRSVANASYFVDVARESLPLLQVLVEDKDAKAQRTAAGAVQSAARVVNELYVYDVGPVLDEAKPKDRFGPVSPLIKSLSEIGPKLAAPLSSPVPDNRIAGAQTLESLAYVRRSLLNSAPPEGPTRTDPFTTTWSTLSPVLSERIHDPNTSVRLAVTQALETIGDAVDFHKLLREATADRNIFVRWSAARALGETAPQKPEPAAVAEDVAALSRLTADRDTDVRSAALAALAKYGTGATSASKAVLAAASRGDVEPRVAAIKALGALKTDAASTLPVLIAALKEKDLRLQRAGATGLVRFGPDAKPALPELRTALNSTDTELRLAAAQAILAIEGKRPLKEL